MGLLDAVVGALGSSSGGGGQADLLGAVIGLLGQAGGPSGGLGGLAGLVARLQQSGLGDVAASWVGTGPNQAISPDQLGGVLGGDVLADLSRQLGMNPGDLLGQLSQVLPQVVDRLTPEGRIPQGDIGGLLGGALGTPGGQAPDLGDLAGLLGGLLKR